MTLSDIGEKLLKNSKTVFYSVSYVKGKEEYNISDSVELITGYTADEIMHMSGKLMQIVTAEDIASIRHNLAGFETDEKSNHLTLVYRIIAKNDKLVWLLDEMVCERDKNGKTKKTFSVISDITAIKENEEKSSKMNIALKEASDAKDRFISILSHDLRAPFTSILGFAEILLNEPEMKENERKEYLNYIFDSSQNQLHLVNYLLDWSRLYTGRIKLEPQRLKAKTIIDSCVSALTGNAVKKNITTTVDASDEFYVLADERLLSQAVSNLISNAVKFTLPNKAVSINVNRFKEGLLEFVIKDEGIGIKESNKSKIFKFDKKFSTDGTSGEKGSGLGLALVKEIVEKHGGDIWFYSEENVGSEFHITIPEASKIVMIVEDDPAWRTLWKNLIAKTLPGFKILQTSNGYEAMTTILTQVPSLVITDHEMPLMNGIQLIEAMKKKDENNRIPVIVVSGQLSPELEERYHELGVSRIIRKPFENRDFSAALLDAVK